MHIIKGNDTDRLRIESIVREQLKECGRRKEGLSMAKKVQRFAIVKKKLLILAGILFLLLLISNQLITFVTDIIWFRQIGYLNTYLRGVFASLMLGIPIFLCVSLPVYLFFNHFYKDFLEHFHILEDESRRKFVKRGILVVSLVMSFIFTKLMVAEGWMDMLKAIYGVSFGTDDPIFHKDLGFYVFQLSFMSKLLLSLSDLVMLLFLTSVVFGFLLILYLSPSLLNREEEMSSLSSAHPKNMIKSPIWTFFVKRLRLFGVLFFLLIAGRSLMMSYFLLYSKRGAVFGAGYTDVVINLWVYRFDAVLALVAGAILLVRKKLTKKLAMSLIAIMLFVNVGSAFLETVVQNFVVAPNELSKEKPYIENAIKYTKLAYGLDKIETREFDLKNNLTAEALSQNQETVMNISLNDYRPTNEAFNQLQGLRGYYRFSDVDIDRYLLDGNLTQVFLSVREMDKSKLEDKAQNWINTKLKYTHGYGLAMAPVNQLTSSGQPEMVMKNVPIQSDYPNLALEKPQIYFGELATDYVIVNTKELEFDYPKGESNEMTQYQGNGGIPLNFVNRLLFAIRQHDFKILISENINSESKILIHRDVLGRVKKIAPFLSYDSDIYPVAVNGRVMYLIDGYTVSEHFPYSQPIVDEESMQEMNYIRNSFKVVVDSYDGDVSFYVLDETDPIVKTYAKIFPDLFKPIDAMPSGIKEHLRYPQQLFDIQSEIYSTYHMNDSQVFYNREDQWSIPSEFYGGEESKMESIYSTYRIPGEKQAEFLLSIPYTPKAKQNLTGLLIARNDGEEYGKLILYRMPKDKIVIGPQQMEGKFSNNDKISKDLSLWNSRGSEVLRGHILTIPIDDSLLYIEPLYIRASGENAIPEVKRIMVGYKDQIVMEESLSKALEQIFASDGKEIPESNHTVSRIGEITTMSEKIQEAVIKYKEAQEALRNGSLSEYQQKVDEMGALIEELEKQEEIR